MSGIYGVGNIVNAMQYANQVRKNQTSSTDFASSLEKASGTDKVETYKSYLEEKFGVPIMEVEVWGDQDSMDRFAAGTVGAGNVAIAPNILEEMANDPEKAAHYEKIIQGHFDSLPQTEAFMASIGHQITSCGVVIHPDGTAHYYLSGEESPEYKAMVEAEHKAKQEKKAKQARENAERNQKIAEERRRVELENLKRQNLESVLYTQRLDTTRTSYADSTENLLTAFEMTLPALPDIREE